MRKFLIPLLVVLGLLGAACGDDSGSATGSEPETEAPTEEQDAPADDATSADGGLVVEDNTGGEATLEAPAERVVVLEWDFAEHLLAVGVDPLGVADVDGYGDWLASELPEGVTDVGTRQEPSLEQIAALEPDLIVGVDFRHEAIRDQLEAIAPTLILRDFPEPGQGSELELMVEALTTIGEATGRSEEAEEALAGLEQHLEDAGTRLEEAGMTDVKVAIAQGFSNEGVPFIRMFTDGARGMELLAEVGIDNAWDGPAEQYGFNTVDVEGLTALPDDTEFLYIAQEDDDIFADTYASDPVWQSLGFVQAGNVTPLGGDTWTWGGAQSAKVFVDRVVDALIG